MRLVGVRKGWDRIGKKYDWRTRGVELIKLEETTGEGQIGFYIHKELQSFTSALLY